MPLLISNLYKEKNIYLRGLADTFHFSIPIWGEFLKMVGAVVGSRPTCSALMGAGYVNKIFENFIKYWFSV